MGKSGQTAKMTAKMVWSILFVRSEKRQDCHFWYGRQVDCFSTMFKNARVTVGQFKVDSFKEIFKKTSTQDLCN